MSTADTVGIALPEGWASVTLVRLVAMAIGGDWGSPPEQADDESLISCRVIRGTEFRNWDVEKGSTAASRAIHRRKLESRRLGIGDLILEVSGGGPRQPVGRTILIDGEALQRWAQPLVCSNFCRRLKLVDGIDPAFVWWNLRLQHSTGCFDAFQTQTTNLRNLNVTDFLNGVDVPLPPLAEQKRIVAKIESLLAKVQSARARLARVPLLLKRLRQSILAAACDGRLTQDWRDGRELPCVPNDREGDLPKVDEIPALPVDWRYLQASDIVAPGTVITYGIVLPGPKQDEGIPYIRGQDIDDEGRIHVDQLWRTTNAIAAKHKRSELHAGDVLLCVIRHLRVAVVPPGLDGANLTQGTVRLRPGKEVLGGFLARYLASPQAQDWMKSRYIGMAMPRINVEHARNIPIAIPPIAEQREIIRRVDSLYKLADAIERRVAAATARADKLTQAILAKAFRGELVPTEADLARAECRDYEPAPVLLEQSRIAQQDALATTSNANGHSRRRSRARA